MPKGISIHIGLNFVDAGRYNGWSGQLSGCVNDAQDMQRIAQSLGYTSKLMTNAQATSTAVISEIGKAAQQLTSGDILLLTYSGHGGQVADANGDEPDGMDETWVLYDRMVVDDELSRLWTSFKAGVRVFALSDSCHSGTVLRSIIAQQVAATPDDDSGATNGNGSTQGGDAALANIAVLDAPIARGVTGGGQPFVLRTRALQASDALPKIKYIDPITEQFVRTRDKDLYATVQWLSDSTRAAVNASVILISGCQDNQVSLDGARNGLFTEKLLKVWNSGAFTGNYRAFHQAILTLMPSTQTPNLDSTGVALDAFLAQRPFSIATASSSTAAAAIPPATIAGPANAARGESAPTFSVNPGASRFYAVEVATRCDLFNSAVNGAQRTADNFYGSWTTMPLLSAPGYPAEYTLPDDVWARLSQSAPRLYYRLWASDAASSWTRYTTSTADGDAVRAPSLEILAAVLDGGTATPDTGTGVPSIIGPSTIPNGTTPPRFQVNPGPNRYYAVELATQASLFDFSNSAQRNPNNFYGSWETTPFRRSPSYPASFDVPAAVWQRLRQSGSALYYRLWATDSANSWVRQEATTDDADYQNAPAVGITRDAAAASASPQAPVAAKTRAPVGAT
jgi:hypothetical protein